MGESNAAAQPQQRASPYILPLSGIRLSHLLLTSGKRVNIGELAAARRLDQRGDLTVLHIQHGDIEGWVAAADLLQVLGLDHILGCSSTTDSK